MKILDLAFLKTSFLDWSWGERGAVTAVVVIALAVALFAFVKVIERLTTRTYPSWQQGQHRTLGGQAPAVQGEREAANSKGDRELRKAWHYSRYLFLRRQGLLYVKPRHGYGYEQLERQLEPYSKKFLGASGRKFVGAEDNPSRWGHWLGYHYVLYVDQTASPVKAGRLARTKKKDDT